MIDGSWLAELIALGLGFIYVLALLCAIDAILQARTSQGAIAWAISLLTFPYISVPLFLIFGRNRFDGYLERRHQMEAESQRLIQRTSNIKPTNRAVTSPKAV